MAQIQFKGKPFVQNYRFLVKRCEGGRKDLGAWTLERIRVPTVAEKDVRAFFSLRLSGI